MSHMIVSLRKNTYQGWKKSEDEEENKPTPAYIIVLTKDNHY